MSLVLKSLIASLITGILAELSKILILITTNSSNTALILGSSIGYMLAYMGQRYVFGGGKFFGISFFKYFSVAILGIQLSTWLLKFMQNRTKIRQIIDNKENSEFQQKLYKYLLINICILSVFILYDFPLRKRFIFVKHGYSDYSYSYYLCMMSVIMYLVKN